MLDMATDIWVITAYFNPARYVTKKANFDRFAARLQATGAELLVVEMALADHDFELGDEHRVVRVRGNGEMWQKERMLNVAVGHLPATCRKVAWLDCDLLFEDDAWLDRTSAALEQHAVVQPFSTCVRLARGTEQASGAPGELTSESFSAAFARDPLLARDAVYQDHGHTGFAWAARRELLEACGFYDACLTGSGDHLMAHVFAGKLDSHCIPAMIGSGHGYAEHFARWAEQVDRVTRGNLGYVPGRVLHLWHGEKANRRYRERNHEFKTFAFDPARHLRLDGNGLWDWADAPDAMRAWSHDMFASRKEDGESAADA